MASVAGRQIDTRFQNTSLLNQAASQSTSLYQKCSSLRDKLLRIRGFKEHFPDLTSSSDSIDPVTQLWDLFAMGTPLCYIFDQLPAEEGFKKLDIYSLVKRGYDLNLDREKKRAIVLFAMQLRTETVLKKIPECEMFTVTDIWDRHSTDGLVKVVNAVTAIVNYLPQDAFEENQSSTNPASDMSLEDAPHKNIIREMLETERKYVQDLETMQKFSNALSQSNIIDQDTIHLLFPNLNKLVNFQRKFLIRLEFTAQLPLKFQRWGQQFIEYEEEFAVYEPYCVNYKNAVELMLSNEPILTALNHLINVKSELPALLLKPIQRVCQYPLLLDSLVKVLSIKAYDHQYELVQGSEAAKRVIDKINEAQRRAENREIVKNLATRVVDWKGHNLENFGDLLLHDVFVVTKSDIDRVYVSFLFEKILVLCKEDRLQRKGSKKKKISNNELLATSRVSGSTPLLMKGRIFANNIVSAKPVTGRERAGSSTSKAYPLIITWKGDDGPESFTMQCTRQEQMKQWEETINRVIETRKSTPKLTASPSRAEVTLRTRFQQFNAWAQPSQSRYSTMSHSTLPLYSLHSEDGDGDEDVQGDTENPLDRELVSDGEDDLEDYPPPSYPPSGRETPVEARALTRSRSLPTKFKSKIKDVSSEASSSQDHQTNTSRARSNSLPAMPTPSDPVNEPSDSDPTPPRTPLASIAEDLFQSPGPAVETSEAVRLKVYYQEDLFVMVVPRSITHEDLIQKIERKVKLCASPSSLPRGPLKVRYKDEDGDLVSLTSTEDVQLAFDQWGPGKASFVLFFVA